MTKPSVRRRLPTFGGDLRMRGRVAAALIALACSTSAAALAGPEEEARERFQRGLELFRRESWGQALAEFLESRRLHPTRAATRNAALAYRKLGRHDVALALYEELLAAPKLSADDKAQYEREADEIAKLVGTIQLVADEQGATLSIDGFDRGVTPFAGPLRVPAGTHTILLYKDGYAPHRAEIAVAGGKNVVVTAPLRPLALSGRLRVREATGRVVDVFIDGAKVGRTPWEGALALGAHAIVLSGEGALGTQPANAAVQPGELTRLSLALEALTAELRIQPTPAGALVSLDGVPLGLGSWQGRVRAGAHDVEAVAPGYVTARRALRVAKDGSELVVIELERELARAAPRPQGALVLEGSVGGVVGASLGGEVLASPCPPPCARTPAFGALALAHVGYRFPSGVSLGGVVGYAYARQDVTARAGELLERPDALRRDRGALRDDVSLHALVLGAWVGVESRDRVFVRGRLGAGVALGGLSDRRSGTFLSQDGLAYSVGPLTEGGAAAWATVSPELRLGYRVTPRFELTVGAHALLLAPLAPARWSNAQDVVTSEFFGFFREETYGAGPLLLLAPTAGVAGVF